jgi:hypothetical protein
MAEKKVKKICIDSVIDRLKKSEQTFGENFPLHED